MLNLDQHGMIVPIRGTRTVVNRQFRGLDKGDISDGLAGINAIIVHQTDTENIRSVFNSYSNATNGSHFVIDKDGTIYQTASLYKQVWHVGYVRPKCLIEHSCTDLDKQAFAQINSGGRRVRNEVKNHATHIWEKVKPYPVRYPTNADAIGIEIVGKAHGRKNHEVFENVNEAKNESLRWLIGELKQTIGKPMLETLRHPDIARKNPTEASTASW